MCNGIGLERVTGIFHSWRPLICTWEVCFWKLLNWRASVLKTPVGIIWFSLTQLRQLLLGFYKKSEIESNGPLLLRGKKRCHISLDLYCVTLALKIFSLFQFTLTVLPLRGAVSECRACGVMVRKGERDRAGRVRSQGMERPKWCWTSHFTLQRAPSLHRPC